MRFVGLLLLAVGCWTDAKPPARTPYPETTPVAREPFPAHSEWRGTYRCSQGLSAMFLQLDAKPDGSLTAVFEFGPTEENPTVAVGAYRLRGTIKAHAENTFMIELAPDNWISAPDGYIMVPLSATSSRKWTRLVGRINHPSCGEVDVRRSD